MLYTIHHGEEGLGAPGCPRSDTCPRRKVAQRWPSDPSCEIDPHRSLVFFANRPFKFCYSNPPSILFCKKPALSTLPIATCPLPPRPPSRRLPAVTALHPLTLIRHGKGGLGAPGHCGRDTCPGERGSPTRSMDLAHTQQSAHSCPERGSPTRDMDLAHTQQSTNSHALQCTSVPALYAY